MAVAKIVIIGGGSYQWSPKLIRDILVVGGLEGSMIVLEDIDPDALGVMHKLTEKMIRDFEVDFKVESTTDQKEALKGADFVVVTISTGGFKTMRYDLEIPLKYGVYQSVGDTVGPGGISRALRNIPVFVDLAKDMDELCPDAYLINYTNPMTTLCRAVSRTSKIANFGLCHELFAVERELRGFFKLEDKADMEMSVAGINHFIWILDLKVRGEDGLELLRKHIQEKGTKNFRGVPPPEDPFFDNWTLKLELLKVFGALPAAGDRHLAEFFPYFLTDDTDKGERYDVKLTTISHREEKLRGSKEAAEAMLSGEVTIPKEKSSEHLADIISEIANRKSGVHIVNLPNRGQIANLPQGVVVESFALINANGINPITVGDLPLGILNVVQRHVTNQEMTVEAALTGDRKLALEAMLSDPLVRNFEEGKKMFDELLEANREYLPQFFS